MDVSSWVSSEAPPLAAERVNDTAMIRGYVAFLGLTIVHVNILRLQEILFAAVDALEESVKFSSVLAVNQVALRVYDGRVLEAMLRAFILSYLERRLRINMLIVLPGREYRLSLLGRKKST